MLQFAIANGLPADSLGALLEAGADVNGRDTISRETALMIVANFQDVTDYLPLLLSRGADVNAQNASGETALMQCAKQGVSPETIKLLLGAGADPALSNERGETALALARAQLVRFRGYPDLVPRVRAMIALLEQASRPTLGVGKRREDSQPGPLLPFVAENVCPFEGCNYGEWVADADTPVYSKQGDASTRLSTIRQDEVFTAIRGNVWTARPTLVQVTRAFRMAAREPDDSIGRYTVIPLRVGDRLYVVATEGEGWVRVWHQGRVWTVQGFWNGPTSRLEDAAGEVEEEGTPSVWWVEVRMKRGTTGWIKPAQSTE